MNLEEDIEVKKVVSLGTKRSNYFKETQLLLVSKNSKKIKDHLHYKTIYCHKVAQDVKLMIFFI